MASRIILTITFVVTAARAGNASSPLPEDESVVHQRRIAAEVQSWRSDKPRYSPRTAAVVESYLRRGNVPVQKNRLYALKRWAGEKFNLADAAETVFSLGRHWGPRYLAGLPTRLQHAGISEPLSKQDAAYVRGLVSHAGKSGLFHWTTRGQPRRQIQLTDAIPTVEVRFEDWAQALEERYPNDRTPAAVLSTLHSVALWQENLPPKNGNRGSIDIEAARRTYNQIAGDDNLAATTQRVTDFLAYLTSIGKLPYTLKASLKHINAAIRIMHEMGAISYHRLPIKPASAERQKERKLEACLSSLQVEVSEGHAILDNLYGTGRDISCSTALSELTALERMRDSLTIRKEFGAHILGDVGNLTELLLSDPEIMRTAFATAQQHVSPARKNGAANGEGTWNGFVETLHRALTRIVGKARQEKYIDWRELPLPKRPYQEGQAAARLQNMLSRPGKVDAQVLQAVHAWTNNRSTNEIREKLRVLAAFEAHLVADGHSPSSTLGAAQCLRDDPTLIDRFIVIPEQAPRPRQIQLASDRNRLRALSELLKDTRVPPPSSEKNSNISGSDTLD